MARFMICTSPNIIRVIILGRMRWGGHVGGGGHGGGKEREKREGGGRGGGGGHEGCKGVWWKSLREM